MTSAEVGGEGGTKCRRSIRKLSKSEVAGQRSNLYTNPLEKDIEDLRVITKPKI